MSPPGCLLQSAMERCEQEIVEALKNYEGFASLVAHAKLFTAKEERREAADACVKALMCLQNIEGETFGSSRVVGFFSDSSDLPCDLPPRDERITLIR